MKPRRNVAFQACISLTSQHSEVRKNASMNEEQINRLLRELRLIRISAIISTIIFVLAFLERISRMG